MAIGLWLKSWIMTDQTHWGLFRWCYNDEYYDVIKSDGEDGKNSSNSSLSFSDQCHQIRPGDSPAYMEVVRTLSVVSALLIYFSMFFTIIVVKMDTPSCCFTKMVFSSMPSLTAGLLLVVLALHYKEDERWRDLNPSLGLSFWFVLTVAILNLSLSCCLCCLWGRENRRRNLYGVDDFCCLCLGENRRRNLERGDRPYLPSRRLSTNRAFMSCLPGAYPKDHHYAASKMSQHPTKSVQSHAIRNSSPLESHHRNGPASVAQRTQVFLFTLRSMMAERAAEGRVVVSTTMDDLIPAGTAWRISRQFGCCWV
ncbi:hypothetical protein ACOMHN_028673 [Nucella lapillus]